MKSFPPKTDPSDAVVTIDPSQRFCSEDWCAILLGWIVLVVALGATWFSRPADVAERVERYQALTRELDEAQSAAQPDAEQVKRLRTERKTALGRLAANPIKRRLADLSVWTTNPAAAFVDKQGTSVVPGLVGVFLVSLVLFTFGRALTGGRLRGFPPAFACVFLLAVLSFLLAGQTVVNYFGLEYALWALVVGLLISNTLGTPNFLRPAIQTEFYIKTGLVLLGAEVLFGLLLALGLPGVCTSWVVTPVVLIVTYIFGQKVLRIESRSLNMVICADMSVCGVSAAIATAAACRAKKEELSLAIGLSLTFTVAMMVAMPYAIAWVGMDPVLAGAWLGGTIDSTGAVAAAGAMLGESALAVATTVKMIQNVLIGAVAFAVAVYWVTSVERDPAAPRPSVLEIWRRFPKFVLGFLAASILFSVISASGLEGQAVTQAVIGGTSKLLRNWFFCLAFVSIGLETNFRELARFLVGGKPLVLYVCGQTLNLVLSLAMSWLMFEKVFPDAAAALRK